MSKELDTNCNDGTIAMWLDGVFDVLTCYEDGTCIEMGVCETCGDLEPVHKLPEETEKECKSCFKQRMLFTAIELDINWKEAFDDVAFEGSEA